MSGNNAQWRCMALHGVAHVDATDACLVLFCMDTWNTLRPGDEDRRLQWCEKFGKVSVPKTRACLKMGHTIPFLKNEGEI